MRVWSIAVPLKAYKTLYFAKRADVIKINFSNASQNKVYMNVIKKEEMGKRKLKTGSWRKEKAREFRGKMENQEVGSIVIFCVV